MCLLFVKPADATFSDEWLTDFYSRNSDGYGIMYTENGKLCYEKELGTVTQWIAFFRRHEHREACFHLRMRTHGDIDMHNCHPYVVSGYEDFGMEESPIVLMHNGVLSTGNAKDTTKSDTWHFIRDYLRPIVTLSPEVIHTAPFKEMLGKFIGNNRFALMDSTGVPVIINKSQGVTWNNVWFSNTYAWSYYKAVPPKYETSYTPTKYDPNAWKGTTVGKPTTQTGAKPSKVTPMPMRQTPLWYERSSTKTGGTQSSYDRYEADELQALADEILFADGEMYERVTMQKLRRLLLDAGGRGAWDFVQSYANKDITQEQFLAGLEDPRKVRDMVRKAQRSNDKKGGKKRA